jgi:UDP-N-acetylglucosamine:LPS N-acetylglucosamine transferase
MVADGELSPETVNCFVREFFADPSRLHKMGERALALAKPHAARDIVHQCYEMVGHG